ncbi:hypothetical protein LXN57_41690 [Actinoplanes sp. TRM88002]|uniref:MFS transporter n=1 Tax=Paractinoplanes hotanensis TaxID=2906497 RepID=A0ABT0YDE7_9ACTN|nr:hypothetical protein [Actinoplanes hotanensis]
MPNLLLQVPAGLVADTVNRRTLMLVAQAAGLIATAAVLLATATDLRATAIVLVVAAVIEGSAFVFFIIAEVGAVRDVVDEHSNPALGRIVSAAAVITDGAVPIGALAGGCLLAATSPESTAHILLIAMLAAALLCTRYLRPAPHPVTEGAS